MKTLFCTGITGFLGHYIQQTTPAGWQIVGTEHDHSVQNSDITTYTLDLSNKNELNSLLNEVQPDAVFHLAAQSNPNYCELHPQEAAQINIYASQYLGEWCQQANIHCIFTSTDLIFDGQYAPYQEEDQPRPMNEYGRQKRKAELIMQEVYPDVTIARLPLMFGWPPPTSSNFFSDFYQKMKDGEPLNLFVDEFRTPVNGKVAAQGLFLLLKEGVKGIFHLGGKERLSRFELGQQMKEIYELEQAQIQPGKQADVDMAAPRPQDVSLDSTKAYELGYAPPPIKEQLKDLKTF